MKNSTLSDLTLDNLVQWPRMIKVGVVLVISLLIMGAGYWFIVQGVFDEYDGLVAKEVTLKSEFETKQHQASNLQAYRDQLAQMEERFGTMLKQLPSQNEMPGLLEDISKTGVASGLTFNAFEPTQEVIHDFYIELPINITVVGNYHQLALFLSRVAQMSRIVTLHDFSIDITPIDKEKTDSGDVLTMKITAKIYRYRTL